MLKKKSMPKLSLNCQLGVDSPSILFISIGSMHQMLK